jgi:hypothetical protein
MFERMPQSSGNVVGYRAIDTITAADYETLVPQIAALVGEHDNIRLLLDLTAFGHEAPEAWLPDLHFGHEFRKNIDRLAIVGDKAWATWLTRLAGAFYAHDAKHFESAEMDAAWEWVAAED